MRKILIAAAAAAIVMAGLTARHPASASCVNCPEGPPVGGPLLGGAAMPYGAYYGYGPSFFFAPAAGYQGVQIYHGPRPGCFWRNQRAWDGSVVRVQVCT
jgi:hypothetical protein